jgi:hypothetical protein
VGDLTVGIATADFATDPDQGLHYLFAGDGRLTAQTAPIRIGPAAAPVPAPLALFAAAGLGLLIIRRLSRD